MADPGIKDGFSLPAWMKSKPTRDFEPFGSSPPPLDDSFFIIKYPKPEAVFGKPVADIGSFAPDQTPQSTKEQDWSRHTRPCQEVLHGVPPVTTSATISKRSGSDESKDDACGSSVVKVANKMISGRAQRGFAVATPEDDSMEVQAQRYNYSRRGSKSLPVTPLHSPPGSPNSRRRRPGNKFFTAPFEPSEDGVNRSWLTMALLGFKKDLTTSTSTLAEEETVENRLQAISLAESVENLGPAPRRPADSPPEHAAPKPRPAPAFTPKPSELREMNFWSPTSM